MSYMSKNVFCNLGFMHFSIRSLAKKKGRWEKIPMKGRLERKLVRSRYQAHPSLDGAKQANSSRQGPGKGWTDRRLHESWIWKPEQNQMQDGSRKWRTRSTVGRQDRAPLPTPRMGCLSALPFSKAQDISNSSESLAESHRLKLDTSLRGRGREFCSEAFGAQNREQNEGKRRQIPCWWLQWSGSWSLWVKFWGPSDGSYTFWAPWQRVTQGHCLSVKPSEVFLGRPAVGSPLSIFHSRWCKAKGPGWTS